MLNSHDLLKAIAIVLMVVDHIGHYFMPDLVVLRWIGRFSFPLFFFLIGYSTHYRFKGDVLIVMLAIVAQDFALHMRVFPINILGTVIATRAILSWVEHWRWSRENLIILAILSVLCFPLSRLLVDYGAFGLLMALCGYFVRTRPFEPLTKGFLAVICLAYGGVETIIFGFPIVYTIGFIVGLVVLFWMLYHYRLQLFSRFTDTNPVAHLIMLLSRYSLYIYAIHLMAFKLMKVLNPF